MISPSAEQIRQRLEAAIHDEAATYILDRCAHYDLLVELCTLLDTLSRELERMNVAYRRENEERERLVYELSKAESSLAARQQERDELKADYDETRKELNRVANLLAEASIGQNPACSRCGGPHPFDTTVPSVVWNATIRARGLEEYLCLTCIVTAFACFGESFTAELNGGPFQGGLPIEVRIRDCVATDAARISEENTALRFQIASLAEARDGLQAQNEILVMDASDSNACCEQAEAKLSALTAAHARVREAAQLAYDELWKTYGDSERISAIYDKLEAALATPKG